MVYCFDFCPVLAVYSTVYDLKQRAQILNSLFITRNATFNGKIYYEYFMDFKSD